MSDQTSEQTGVHNLAEYVKFHQQKLREQNARAAAAAAAPAPPQKSSGVNSLSSKGEFDTKVVNGQGVAVIDFFATWCGPCKMIAPTIVKFSKELPDVSFYKVDVDEVPAVAQELSIRAMPTFVIFKNGEKVDEVVGANAGLLRQKIDAAIKSKATGQPYERPPEPFNWMQYLPVLILAFVAYRWYMGI